MKILALLAIPLISCGAPAGFTVQYGFEAFETTDDGIQEALDDCGNQWADTKEIGERLDIFTLSEEKIKLSQYCGLSGAKQIKACTMWIGHTEFPAERARMYVLEGVSPSAAVRHECQHWHSWWNPTDGCADHRAECWDYDLPQESQ